jgi:hypothetical protein
MYFVYPEGFVVKGIESQDEAHEQAENKDKDLFPFFFICNMEIEIHRDA